MKDKLAGADKVARESLNYELQYYRRYYERKELKCTKIVAASISSFREKVTVYDKNFEFTDFENKCKIIASNPEPKAELCFYE